MYLNIRHRSNIFINHCTVVFFLLAQDRGNQNKKNLVKLLEVREMIKKNTDS